jgi:ATP-dependent Clp protease adaptor protein ClpS
MAQDDQNEGTGPGSPGFDDEDGVGSGVLTERKVRADRPNLYKVLLHNDDYTPMEFVIDVLERFFSKSHAEATEIMLTVHYKGVGTCGVFPYEVAETKVALVTEAAREQEYPLQCSMERA